MVMADASDPVQPLAVSLVKMLFVLACGSCLLATMFLLRSGSLLPHHTNATAPAAPP
jgi:hypothetical protein